MARKWLQSASIEVSAAGALSVSEAGTAFAGSTKTVAAAATPQALVSAPTPCKGVWIGARMAADMSPQNTGACWIGDSAGQNLPILPTDFAGVFIKIDDASKLFVKVAVNGQGVAYRILA